MNIKKETRGCAFCVDDAYLPAFLVFWESLISTESLPSSTQVFLVHTDSLSPRNRFLIDAYLSRFDICFHRLYLDSKVLTAFPLSKGDHVSPMTYARLYLASLVPEGCDSIVYFDCDMYAIKSARYLFDINLEKPVAAAYEWSSKESERLWGDAGIAYFNAGVLVIDLAVWRELDIPMLSKSIIDNMNTSILWWDQDILNIIFKQSWQIIPHNYNLTWQADYETKMNNAMFLPPVVIHYNDCKPWVVFPHPRHGFAWIIRYYYLIFTQNPLELRPTMPTFRFGYLLAFLRSVLKSSFRYLAG